MGEVAPWGYKILRSDIGLSKVKEWFFDSSTLISHPLEEGAKGSKLEAPKLGSITKTVAWLSTVSMDWFIGWGICIGKEGELGRERGIEDRHDSHTLRNLTTSMWFSRDFPILGHSSRGSSDQSTMSSMASNSNTRLLSLQKENWAWSEAWSLWRDLSKVFWSKERKYHEMMPKSQRRLEEYF